MVSRASVVPLRSCTPSANIVGWPASAIIVGDQLVGVAPRGGRARRARTRARSVGGIGRPTRPRRTRGGPRRSRAATSASGRDRRPRPTCVSSAGFSTASDSSPSTQRPGHVRPSLGRSLQPRAPPGPRSERTFYLSRNGLARNPRSSVPPARSAGQARSGPVRPGRYADRAAVVRRAVAGQAHLRRPPAGGRRPDPTAAGSTRASAGRRACDRCRARRRPTARAGRRARRCRCRRRPRTRWASPTGQKAERLEPEPHERREAVVDLRQVDVVGPDARSAPRAGGWSRTRCP